MIQVTFKDEDEVDGMAIGPVTVIDTVVMAADPIVAAAERKMGLPYGYTPQGVTRLGWLTKAEAYAVAREHGVELSTS